MILEVSNLEYAFKTNHVLKKMSFSADEGQCICVLGQNGAGKTTLFRCILGLLRGYKGDIIVQGINSRKLSVKEMAKRISYIPQAHAPTFNYTVFQTVLMGTNVYMDGFKTPNKNEYNIVMEKLELLSIKHLAERGYAELSGGERQLVLIARALVQNAKILIMDEPTANLDYGNQLRIMWQVKKLAQQGYLILLSTHNPEHALHFADTALIMKNGNVLEIGNPKEILRPNLIETIYGVNVNMETINTTEGEVTLFVPKFNKIAN